MHIPLSKLVQKAAEEQKVEVSSEHIRRIYDTNFVNVNSEWQLQNYELHTENQQIEAKFTFGNREYEGHGSGALEAICDALTRHYICAIEVLQYDQHAVDSGTNAQALACIQVKIDGQVFTAVAQNTDTSNATLQALLTAVSHSNIQLIEGVA